MKLWFALNAYTYAWEYALYPLLFIVVVGIMLSQFVCLEFDHTLMLDYVDSDQGHIVSALSMLWQIWHETWLYFCAHIVNKYSEVQNTRTHKHKLLCQQFDYKPMQIQHFIWHCLAEARFDVIRTNSEKKTKQFVENNKSPFRRNNAFITDVQSCNFVFVFSGSFYCVVCDKIRELTNY